MLSKVEKDMTPSMWKLGLLRGNIEIRQFMRQRESVVFTIAFPLILLAIFGSVFSESIAPGVTFSQYFEFGSLKRLRGTPMAAASYFIGKSILVFVTMIIQVILLLAAGVAFFGVDLPTDPYKWFTFTWLIIWGSAASTTLGIAFSAIPKSGRGASAVVSPVVIVLQFISGVFFIFTQLPGWMQQVGAIFPLKWMTQAMRSVFLPDSFASQEVAGQWEIGRSFLVISIWLVIGLVFSLRTFRWSDR